MRIIYLLMGVLLMASCGAYLNQPLKVSEARIAQKTNLEKQLLSMPKPKEPIVVAIYKFKDQTGQYKPSEVGSSFSTAVTQGGTNILIKALDDSGWFKVIERENIGNLLNERKIIRQTRMQYQSNDDSKVLVNPLLFAGVILEGGIVSYDANIVSGGIGVRYFGTGGSTAYRQDRVTIYLRAIATKTGEVLKNITTSKTILSQSLDGGVFRYVKFSRLLEAETGFTFNEPSDIAVTEAVQKAVYSLVVEGVKEGLWSVDTLYREEEAEMLEQYDTEISAGDLEDYLGVKTIADPRKLSASISGNGLLYQGDFPFSQVRPALGFGIQYDFNKYFGIGFDYHGGALEARESFNLNISNLDINARLKLLGDQSKNPYLKFGLGTILSRGGSQANGKISLGAGLDYNINTSLSLTVSADWNQFLRDDFDGFTAGRYIDYYYRFGLGLKYHIPSNFKKK